jgi:phospholipid transport system substrate-binding protein
MHHVFKWIVGALLLALWSVSPAGADQQPLARLQAKIEPCRQLLEAPDPIDGAQRMERERQLWRLSQRIFDFQAMSRLVLTSHWKALTPSQRHAFIVAFAEFLRRTYLPQLIARYNGQQVVYLSQRLLSPSRARVGVNVIWNGAAVPLDIRMIQRDGDWFVYDVMALGISAIENYRAQIDALLQHQSPDQLVARLRAQRSPVP